jgi:hypothetical protein
MFNLAGIRASRRLTSAIGAADLVDQSKRSVFRRGRAPAVLSRSCQEDE